MTSAADPPTKLCFAFGSNLWRTQMALGCPGSPFIGVGRLRGYDARGCANSVPSAPMTDPERASVDDEVWGFVYALSAADEAQIDRGFGVPHASEKRIVPVEFWPASQTDGGLPTVPSTTHRIMNHTTNRAHPGHTPPPEEHAERMIALIRDALRAGVPRAHIEALLRSCVPLACAAGDFAAWWGDGREARTGGDGGTEGRVGSVSRSGVGSAPEKGGCVVGKGATAKEEENEEEEEELPERASEVCYMKYYMP
ncbi:593dbe40-f4ee-4f72-8033-aac5027a69b7 [Thermothielavioides terrestris]|uniref:593dbe40-f4ee-4f72-8033-aac5027a69b7 n=1 Tax=Thermothielavioides terrestris TaxID=2587410 RepID=A0A3S4BG61_9PEZI|nr:593dbe40-f4ee-4f72-8033-aac5027a69b7 [Thermothielavioides terrestris]